MPPAKLHIMEQSDPRSSSVTSAIGTTVSRYIKLLLEDTRLNVAEKLTRLFSALTVCALVLVLALATLLFMSIAAGMALADIMNPILAYSRVVLCRARPGDFFVQNIAYRQSHCALHQPSAD